jgi:hypothetical protein
MNTKRWRLRLGLAALTAVSGGVFVASAAAAPPANTTSPTISGTPTVGQTLSASTGTWSNSPTSFAYQWLRCNGGGNNCVDVANGTQKSYTLVGADAGHTMRVRVTATNAEGSSPAQSAQTATVTSATSSAAPKNTAPPAVSGTAKVGQQLTADTGAWSGNPTSFTLQWQRCDADAAICSNIVGATGKTYGIQNADLGYRLRVIVTARNAKGTATTPSALTSIVAPTATITNHRPSLRILRVQFTGATVYATFRICDDSSKNLAIKETEPSRVSRRRF